MLMRSLCCCCGLHTGCLVIASLGIIGGIIFLGYGSVLLHTSREDSSSSYVGIAGIVLICDGVIHLLACASLFAGTSKAKKGLLIPYIVVATLSILTSIAACAMGNYLSVIGIVLWIYMLAVVGSRYSELGQTSETSAAAIFKN